MKSKVEGKVGDVERMGSCKKQCIQLAAAAAAAELEEVRMPLSICITHICLCSGSLLPVVQDRGKSRNPFAYIYSVSDVGDESASWKSVCSYFQIVPSSPFGGLVQC